jgi:hypothetical protein
MDSESMKDKIIKQEFGETKVEASRISYDPEVICGCSYCGGKEMSVQVAHFKLYVPSTNTEYYLRVKSLNDYVLVERDEPELGNNGEQVIDDGEEIDKAEYVKAER